MGSQIWATIALESVYRTNCSLQASTIHFRVSAISGFTPAKPPTMAQPRHQLSLGSLCGQHTAIGTSPTIPCVKLSLELPRRTGSGVTGASPQCIKDKDRSVDHAAIVISYRVRKCHLRPQDAT